MADLKDLKPGDEVAIVQTYQRGNEPRIVPIERVTPTKIVADGRRWRRDTGTETPKGSFYQRCIVPATDEHRHAAERGRLWAVIYRAFMPSRSYEVRRELSTEAMRTIAGALKADEARRGERG